MFYESVNPARYVTNLSIGYQWALGLQWVVGADNVFDVYPKALPPGERYIGAAKFDTNTGVSIDGGYYYTRLSYNF